MGNLISVIITSYDLSRSENINNLLDSIKRQTASNFEVIFITEGDTRLNHLVKELMLSKGIPGKVVHNYGVKGLAAARNLGVEVASGQILGFVDDDVILGEGWCQAVQEAFQNFPDMIGATGPAYPLWIGAPADWLPKQLDWLIGCTRWFNAKQQPMAIRNCWGMNMCFRRSAFEKAGMFSVESGFKLGAERGAIGEDVEFSLRVRYVTHDKLMYLPDMQVWNKVYPYRLSNSFIIRRSFWIGQTRKTIEAASRRTRIESIQTERSVTLSLVKLLITGSWIRGIGSIRNAFKLLSVSLLSIASFTIGYLFGE